MGFPRQEFWRGLPFLSLGDLPNPGIEPLSPALAGRFFPTEPLGKSHVSVYPPSKLHTFPQQTLKEWAILMIFLSFIPLPMSLGFHPHDFTDTLLTVVTSVDY